MPSPRAPGNESLPLSGDSPGLRVQWKVGPPISAGQNEKNTARSSTPDSSLSKKKKKREIREKIINGFDSDSEDESDIVEETKPKSKTIGEVAEGPDLDGELAALVEEQEVDELEDDDADAIEQMRQKRSVSIDDDISGEVSFTCSSAGLSLTSSASPSFWNLLRDHQKKGKNRLWHHLQLSGFSHNQRDHCRSRKCPPFKQRRIEFLDMYMLLLSSHGLHLRPYSIFHLLPTQACLLSRGSLWLSLSFRLVTTHTLPHFRIWRNPFLRRKCKISFSVLSFRTLS